MFTEGVLHVMSGAQTAIVDEHQHAGNQGAHRNDAQPPPRAKEADASPATDRLQVAARGQVLEEQQGGGMDNQLQPNDMDGQIESLS